MDTRHGSQKEPSNNEIDRRQSRRFQSHPSISILDASDDESSSNEDIRQWSCEKVHGNLAIHPAMLDFGLTIRFYQLFCTQVYS
jgi:hypothetical protein